MKAFEENVDIRRRNGFSKKTSITIFALLSIFLLVTTALSVTFIVLYATRDRSSSEVSSSSGLSDICQTDACFNLSLQIKGFMNENVDPCEDFYNFSCGNWVTYNRLTEGKVGSGTVTIPAAGQFVNKRVSCTKQQQLSAIVLHLLQA